MSISSKIPWTEATWNPVVGCSKKPISTGCDNCYAKSIATRFSGKGNNFHGVAKNGKWTGDVIFSEKKLHDPLKWSKPKRIFAGSMGDIFYSGVSESQLVRIFQIMNVCRRHTFIILTKRPGRMLDFLNDIDMSYFPHVWFGVSVENQQAADQRIPILLETEATVKFISCEPLIGEVDIEKYIRGLDWVIAGGENGTGARICDFLWIDSLRMSCRDYGVPFFFKGYGSWVPNFGICNSGSEQVKLNKSYRENTIVRNFGELDAYYYKVGSKHSSDLIFGKQYHEYPG
jgi:protein gp37